MKQNGKWAVKGLKCFRIERETFEWLIQLNLWNHMENRLLQSKN